MEKLKVMVVDDESRMRKLVRDFLVRQDFDVIANCADNGHVKNAAFVRALQ